MRTSVRCSVPGRLVRTEDGVVCDRREWCLVAHLRDDEDEYLAAHPWTATQPEAHR